MSENKEEVTKSDPTLKLIKSQIEKEPPREDDGTPAFSEEALKEVLKNVKNDGVVWKKDDESP